MQDVLTINTIGDYLALRKQEVLHPLVGIVDFKHIVEEGNTIKGYDSLHFNCYAIFIKDTKGCKIKYGGKDYDYDEGTLVFIAPNQTIGLGNYSPNYKPKGYALLFHPDLLLGTELGRKIHSYSFFAYSSNEALHLSTKERRVILSLLEKIQFELEQTIDKHSKKLIVSNIELFLDYCTRFYDRQFLTREIENIGSLEKFEKLLNDYFASDQPQKYGTPSVGYFAECLHLSSNYFGDLVKKETGKSAQEYIQNKLIEVAKERVFDPNKSVSEIAYGLGFKYPQHFTRLFKQRVGHSPSEFRNLN
ncbi:helix-turn-helix transcriptional regulator [Flagellimonas halotolerans]|uniref:Helix-turn-helix transcriptional regulator n=1 Tax=Flagellimonas halotolerans TaxID=3112164 RepID=A0ABU6IQ99_9FLAO|nr:MULTISPECIES: helix-turn-helix transcriptional regulator [unclassified Allomuricauda]MEC3965301.1 helix-turn-helix transcriptional regulator [Muricauda sp. SYSU M86414]MEC4265167.1 helix-turn-helix transcriptional regulator [Muricauda sp. SYSU M84420]